MALIKWNERDGRVRLELPADLDLPMAQQLVDNLRHAFAVADAVEILARDVERISTACLQALLVSSRWAGEEHHPFAIVDPSETFIDACSDLGVSDWLKQWRQS